MNAKFKKEKTLTREPASLVIFAMFFFLGHLRKF